MSCLNLCGHCDSSNRELIQCPQLLLLYQLHVCCPWSLARLHHLFSYLSSSSSCSFSSSSSSASFFSSSSFFLFLSYRLVWPLFLFPSFLSSTHHKRSQFWGSLKADLRAQLEPGELYDYTNFFWKPHYSPLSKPVPCTPLGIRRNNTNSESWIIVVILEMGPLASPQSLIVQS